MTRIHLISGPRNISTALMYAFGNRLDCDVVDEPFYAYYLQKTAKNHPGQAEILASQSCDIHQLKTEVIFGDYSAKAVFFKNMAHHIIDMNLSFLLDLKNVILIRDPAKMIHSFSKVIESPKLEDFGLKRASELFDYLVDDGQHPIVLSTDQLLIDPNSVLQQLCKKLEILFSQRMLSWPPGPRKEDGVWAKYWYKNVHSSDGFTPKAFIPTLVEERFKSLYQSCLPYYNKLFEQSIKA